MSKRDPIAQLSSREYRARICQRPRGRSLNFTGASLRRLTSRLAALEAPRGSIVHVHVRRRALLRIHLTQGGDELIPLQGPPVLYPPTFRFHSGWVILRFVLERRPLLLPL